MLLITMTTLKIPPFNFYMNQIVISLRKSLETVSKDYMTKNLSKLTLKLGNASFTPTGTKEQE